MMARLYTAEDALSRAERERERERNDKAVDDMLRLEDELADVIVAAEALVRDGWTLDITEALTKAREALALVQKRRRIVETFR